MIDQDIHNLLTYTEARSEEHDHDPHALAEALGYRIVLGDSSEVNHDLRLITLRRDLPPLARRSDLAHELGHALAHEGHPRSYARVITRNHASVENIHAHREVLTDHQGDRITMPKHVVEAVIRIVGLNARAVWVLHQTAHVMLPDALRRIVHFFPDARMGGFITSGGVIKHAESFRWHMPMWIGHRVPDDFPEEHLFPVPARRSVMVGLVVVEA